MAEAKSIYFTNASARSITVDGVRIPPKGVGKSDNPDHKGVKKALKDGWFIPADEKEYAAYTDPAAVQARLDAEAKTGKEKSTK